VGFQKLSLSSQKKKENNSYLTWPLSLTPVLIKLGKIDLSWSLTQWKYHRATSSIIFNE